MSKIRFLKFCGAAAASALLLMPGTAAADVTLGMDQVRVLKLKRPVKSVSVGNALIADATIVDDLHIFITGREFGTTNVVALDDEGNLVTDEMVTVTTPQGAQVTLTRGSQWYTLSCNAGRCDVRPTPGDDYQQRFGPDSTAIIIRETTSTEAASVSAPAPQ